MDTDGNLIISARKTSATYKIDRKSDQVLWRLDGERGDFEMAPGTPTRYQHDARRRPDGTLTLFDNGGEGESERSRAIVVRLDESAMRASLVSGYVHNGRRLSVTQGNMQVLPNGNAFVGWGSAPYLTEHDGDGKLLFDARFPREVESYRASRFPWKGVPQDRPAVAAEAGAEGRVTLYASWNGATEVADWEVLAGPDPERLEPVGSVPRKGFETAISFNTDEPYVAARAKDRSGRVLGTSEAVKRGS